MSYRKYTIIKSDADFREGYWVFDSMELPMNESPFQTKEQAALYIEMLLSIDEDLGLE